MRAAWFGTGVITVLAVQALLWWHIEKRNEPTGELVWPSFFLSIGTVAAQSVWGAALVRPAATWTRTRAIARGMAIGLLVGVVTGWGGGTAFLLFLLVQAVWESGLSAVRELGLLLGILLPAPFFLLFHSLVGGAVAGGVVGARKHRLLQQGS